jgi:hypothetical protein
MPLAQFFGGNVPLSAIVKAGTSNDPAATVLQLYEWERDRVSTLAKGIAASAASFLATLAIASLKSELRAPSEDVLLALFLPIELLLIAADSAWGSHRLSMEFPHATTVAEFIKNSP